MKVDSSTKECSPIFHFKPLSALTSQIKTMNKEFPRAFLTTKFFIHPNQNLTSQKPHYLYDELDELEINNVYL